MGNSKNDFKLNQFKVYYLPRPPSKRSSARVRSRRKSSPTWERMWVTRPVFMIMVILILFKAVNVWTHIISDVYPVENQRPWRWPLLVTRGISGQERRQDLCPGGMEIMRDNVIEYGSSQQWAFCIWCNLTCKDVLFLLAVPIIDSDLYTGRKRKWRSSKKQRYNNNKACWKLTCNIVRSV